MSRIIVFSSIIEIIYLTFSFAIATIYGQWSWEGEILRTIPRIISILFYGYFYQQYFYRDNRSFTTRKILTPPFAAALFSFILFAAVYTNVENEPLIWQIVFAFSGLTAGLREELFYRGMVQNSLQMKYGYKTALIMATLLFSLSHVQYIYWGQTRAVILITMAGLIFGSIFIHTGSVVFTAIIHGLYDAVLSVNLAPLKLSDSAAPPILFGVMLVFLIIISHKLFVSEQTDKIDDSDEDSFSLP